jgi:hypothetical protein
MVYSLVPLFNHILGGVPAPVLTGAISDKFNLPYALQLTALISARLSIVFFFMRLKVLEHRCREAQSNRHIQTATSVVFSFTKLDTI